MLNSYQFQLLDNILEAQLVSKPNVHKLSLTQIGIPSNFPTSDQLEFMDKLPITLI